MSRLADALKRRFATPRAALAALGLDASLLEGTDMTMNHTAALAAVRALKKRGLVIAMDASSEEEAARVISQQGGDRTIRRMRMGDAEMRERQSEEDCRDAMRRAADAETLDPEELKDVLEAIAQHAPEVMAEVQHEMAADGRGPRGWSRDRAERRRAEDTLRRARDARFMRARRMGADDPPPFEGMPRTGGSMVRDMENVGFRRDESWPENGEDRRRSHAYDLAMDSGGTHDALTAWLGPQAASIGKL
jgi:hypothetical protein